MRATAAILTGLAGGLGMLCVATAPPAAAGESARAPGKQSQVHEVATSGWSAAEEGAPAAKGLTVRSNPFPFVKNRGKGPGSGNPAARDPLKGLNVHKSAQSDATYCHDLDSSWYVKC